MKSARFVELLQMLAREDVEIIVVGMLAGVLQGAPVTTLDVDVVHHRTPENAERLLRVLKRIDALYRDDPRRIEPGLSHLLGPGHQLLVTRLGALDCLGTIDGDKTYVDLLAHSVELEIGDGLRVRALDLETLIAFKQRAGRPKDVAALPALRATLDERNRAGS